MIHWTDEERRGGQKLNYDLSNSSGRLDMVG